MSYLSHLHFFGFKDFCKVESAEIGRMLQKRRGALLWPFYGILMDVLCVVYPCFLPET